MPANAVFFLLAFSRPFRSVAERIMLHRTERKSLFKKRSDPLFNWSVFAPHNVPAILLPFWTTELHTAILKFGRQLLNCHWR